jgi:glutaminyl-peptide cyclotransferase
MMDSRIVRLSVLAALLAALGACNGQPATPASLTATPEPAKFDGARALEDVRRQMALGPRPVGSQALENLRGYLNAELVAAGWAVETQTFEYQGVPVSNVIARANVGKGPLVVVGAHYDTRRVADQDPQDKTLPMPGANDGASGAAVLLELARTLDRSSSPYELCLAFFDAEDDGDLNGWDWSVGANYFAGQLKIKPKFAIIVDMVGDRDQQLYLERNSTPAVQDAIWSTAARLGYQAYFIDTPKYMMTDDHTPFLQRGIPAVDIIDFDYPYWHTAADTLDKVGADSLERVGRTLQVVLEEGVAYP